MIYAKTPEIIEKDRVCLGGLCGRVPQRTLDPIAHDFAVLNVLETGAIPGESHIPILVPLSYRSPADGVLAYRVRLDNAVKWIEENKSRHKLVHCDAGIERSPLTVAWYMCRRRVVADLDQAYACLIKQRPVVQDRRMWLESLP